MYISKVLTYFLYLCVLVILKSYCIFVFQTLIFIRILILACDHLQVKTINMIEDLFPNIYLTVMI